MRFDVLHVVVEEPDYVSEDLICWAVLMVSNTEVARWPIKNPGMYKEERIDQACQLVAEKLQKALSGEL